MHIIFTEILYYNQRSCAEIRDWSQKIHNSSLGVPSFAFLLRNAYTFVGER